MESPANLPILFYLWDLLPTYLLLFSNGISCLLTYCYFPMEYPAYLSILYSNGISYLLTYCHFLMGSPAFLPIVIFKWNLLPIYILCFTYGISCLHTYCYFPMGYPAYLSFLSSNEISYLLTYCHFLMGSTAFLLIVIFKWDLLPTYLLLFMMGFSV